MSPFDGIPSYDDNFDPAPPLDLMDLRLPPNSVEAEQAVIGGLLISQNAFDAIADLITENDFYKLEHRTAFTAIAKLAEAAKPHDVITVHDALAAAGTVDRVGGMAYLFELANNTASAANIRAYANVVREKALLRALIATGTTIADMGYATSGRSAAELVDEAQAAVIALGDTGGQERDTHVGSVIQDYVAELDRRAHCNGLVGLATGFDGIDQRTNGLSGGDLIIIGGRPKMGKTSFAMNIVEHVAVVQEQPVLVFSMEMSRTQLVDRMVASLGGIPFSLLRNGTVFNAGFGNQVGIATKRIKNAPLYIDDRAALTIAQMRSAARRQHRKTGLALIVVDYLQLARAKAESRVMEITAISQGLKALAKELDCPVIALSQLSRASENQKRRPIAADLRDSGSIEQDADGIFLIYRDEVYNDSTMMRGTAEIIIPALRNGEAGTEYLDANLAMCRFQNKPGTYIPPQPESRSRKSAYEGFDQ